MAAAKSYSTDRIRNVVVVGHAAAGKTTLVDACCAAAGSVRRHGSVQEGTAVTMFTPEEVSHGLSMSVAVAHAEWLGAKVNLIDTPGYADFAGETAAGIRVADGAVLVVSGTSGVEVGTERVWQQLRERHLPTIVFISMLDRPNVDFEAVFRDVRTRLTDKAIPVEIPVGSGEDFRGIVNLFSERAHIYRQGGERGEYDETEVPEEVRETEARYYEELIETIAATDDTLIEHYLEGEEITREEAIHALKAAMLDGELVPVFCGVAERNWGVRALLSKVVELLPSPAERPATTVEGRRRPVEVRGLDSDPFCALVFKTASEPHLGELSYFRVFGGRVASGEEAVNAERDQTERLAHLAVPLGKDRLEVPELHAGDIGVVARLRDTHTNETLSSPSHPLVIRGGIRFPEPDTALAVVSRSRGDEDKLAAGLHRLHEEDPTFVSEFVSELRQTLIRGLGELHLEVSLERLQRKFGVEVDTEEPRIPYRETIRAEAEGHGRHKKQTGGRGQFGDCRIRLRPLARGEGYRFVNSIVGGAIPAKYVPAVDRGIQEALERGILAGYPVVDVEAECFDGSYHNVDSSEQAFRMAGVLALREAAARARAVLLEPVHELEVTTPDEYLGDVMGDINQRRGRIVGVEATPGGQRIRATVPQAELSRYSSALRSLTQGRGVHRATFQGYVEVPEAVTGRIVEEASAARASA